MAREPQVQPAPPPPIGLPLEPISATAGPPAAEAGGILTIDLGAIHANYRMLTSRVLPVECAAVVKGDAYGCGIDQVTTALTRAGGGGESVEHVNRGLGRNCAHAARLGQMRDEERPATGAG